MAEADAGHELYALDPEAFTGARNALARELRAAGRKEDAGRVAKLRRPPVTAWALNQVARRRPELVGAVLQSGAELRHAMEQALAGDPSVLRDAQSAERRAVDAAVTAASGVLEEAGRAAPDSARQRMAASLRAAVVDPSVADLLRAGVLDGDRDAPGFGLDGLSVTAPPPSARRRPAAGRKATSPPTAPDTNGDAAPGEGGAGRSGAGEAGTGEAGTGEAGTGEAEAGESAENEADVAEAAEAEGRRRGRVAEAGTGDTERRRLSAEADEAEDRARRLEREATEAEDRAARLAAAAAEAAGEAERAARRAEDLEADARTAAGQAATARTEADGAVDRAREVRRRAAGS